MVDQNTFMETVRSVAEIMATAGEPLSEEEILGYFEDMALNEQQKQLVMDYLMNPGEEIKGAEADKGTAADEEGDEDGNSRKPAVFQMYLEELSGLPKYSREEEKQMYEALLQGEEQVIKKLSDAWLKPVLTVAEKYAGPRLSIEDLVQEGNMALFVKLRQLCGIRENVDVERVLQETVEKGILAYAEEVNGERELRKVVLGKVSLIHEARKLLTEENGKEPDLEALAEFTKISVEELAELIDMMETTKNKNGGGI